MLLRCDGTILAASAQELNQHGYRTRRGKEFSKATVRRLLPKEPKKTPVAAEPQRG